MGLENLVELTALGLAIWAASRSVPRPPALDWERLFKTALAVQIVGPASRDGASEAQLVALVEGAQAALLFQPAGGPTPESKLLDPASAPIPVPPLPGERALVEALGRLPELEARWRRMYLSESGEGASLFDDPELLGPDYHPGRVGAGLDWGAVADWSEALQQALLRRMSAFVVVDLGSELGAGIAAAAPGLRQTAVSAEDASPEALAERLLGACNAASDRLVLVVEGAAALPTMRAVLASTLLRDRLIAVLAVGAGLGEGEAAAWMAENFTHDKLEPELNRSIVYAGLVAVAPGPPADASALEGWKKQRFPVPAPSPSGRNAIDAIDLGPLVLTGMERPALTRALALFLAFRLGT